MIDINKAMEEISKLERLQAQIELRINQCNEEEKKLADVLQRMGIKEDEVEIRLEELSNSISERLTFIANLNSAKAPVDTDESVLNSLL
jgi:pimeloyl-CoA synthetase